MYKDPIFKEYVFNPAKALKSGFQVDQLGNYSYNTQIMDQFTLFVNVSPIHVVQTSLIDNITNTEYVLHQNPTGAYSGEVQVTYRQNILKILESAFDSAVFRDQKAQDIIQYIQQTYGDRLEFLWKRTPKNAVIRRPDTNKWYAAFLTVSKEKIGLVDDSETTVLNLHVSPTDIDSIVDNQTYFPGYHMNKKHWISVYLETTEPLDNILSLLNTSYELGAKK